MTSRFPLLSTLAVLTAVGLLALGPPAGAGQHQSGQQAPSAAEQSFSTDELESFASAAPRVGDVARRWQPKIRAAEDAAEAQSLKSKATNEMLSVIEEEGLSPQRYNAIVRAARADPALKTRILDLMQEGR